MLFLIMNDVFKVAIILRGEPSSNEFLFRPFIKRFFIEDVFKMFKLVNVLKSVLLSPTVLKETNRQRELQYISISDSSLAFGLRLRSWRCQYRICEKERNS